jgi:hypothetical protein
MTICNHTRPVQLAAGAQWRLTGGFWGMTLEALADLLFRDDRFEDDQAGPVEGNEGLWVSGF